MNRIKDYAELEERIVLWLREYADNNNIRALVCGVSGGIDSAVVSTLCARTGLPTYVLTMPLNSKMDNTILSTAHATELREQYENVTMQNVELSSTYEKLLSSIDWWTDAHGGEKGTFTSNNLANANTKSRLRMVTLYQIAGTVGGMVVGTGNKVEDYGIGFYTKYGDGGVILHLSLTYTKQKYGNLADTLVLIHALSMLLLQMDCGKIAGLMKSR